MAVSIPATPVQVEVVRDGATWTADFAFDRAAPAWVFSRSALDEETRRSWRLDSWTVVTPGVRLERRGRYDLLVAEPDTTVPQQVQVRFTPYARDLVADYDPALVFTDGSVALYNQHFDAFPINDPAAVAALPIDLDETDIRYGQTRVRFSDRGGHVLYMGQRFNSASLAGNGTYVLFGPLEPIASDAMATIIDPQLPAWLRTALADETPRILAHYAELLGPAPGGRPTFMLSWAGPTPSLRSMGGSVLSGLVVMRFEGAGVLEPSPSLLGDARWFIAHEGAHFWLGQTVRYELSRDAWIMEGGADLLAVRAVQALDPAFDWRGALNRLIAECAELSRGRGVASAEERGENRAYYACGAVFGLAAEAASGRPFSARIRQLIDANRGDGVLTRAEWLAAVENPHLRSDIEAMLDRGADDPAEAIHQLFVRAGVAHGRDQAGLPVLQ